ncbi:hypothetical protein NC651_007938 [Populus alba x Populus x berolinensis]|nr:hypothetical protein NC651_007938 [Populus alba x Populus x berolinensis]
MLETQEDVDIDGMERCKGLCKYTIRQDSGVGQSPAQVFKRCQDLSGFKTRQKLERCLLTCSFKTTSNMINEMT